jgi:DNA polymerase III subunit beta
VCVPIFARIRYHTGMKLSCTQENLAQATAFVAPIAHKGGTLPILQNILLDAREGTLKLSSTNLEIGITTHVRGKIEREGMFTVNGRLFFDYINLVASDTISLELRGEHLEVRAGNQRTTMLGQAATEFPVIPTIENKQAHTIEAVVFREALNQVLFSAAVTDTRPELSGLLLKLEDNTLTLVGTDSYRLAERSLELKSKIETEYSGIVPLRTTQELARILGSSEGELSITTSENQILFSVGESELISRLITGTFPNYKDIIPGEHKTTVTLDTEPLARAIKSASLFCRQGINHVSFQFSENKILVSAAASQIGENHVEVPAKISGSDIDIVFDYRYVLDGLNAIGASDVTIQLEGSASPGVFIPKEHSNYLYLVMPIKQ